jgi:superfamily II DNA or RNA helicase
MPEERLWCPSLRAWVRVLERRELFGRAVAKVVTEDDVVRTVAADTLCASRPFETGEMLSVVAGARIWHALGSDLLLAPVVSRVIPLPHQFRVLRRALSGFPVRMLLADEVGLGKTIEAGLILKELKLRGMAERALVLAPKSLLLQWVAEMELHFGEAFDLVEPGAWGAGAGLRGENLWKRYRQVVTSFDAVKPRSSQKGWSAEKIERFNLERFHDLVGAGWDVVIIDESHKVAGAGDDVARFELASALAKAVPHLLLLSATPHSGKSDAFRRLLSLLDPASFPSGATVTRERVAPFVIRTEKRTTTDADGAPLFAPRTTRLLTVPFEPKHALQQRLYEEISEYVVAGYNRAQRGNQGSRLLLILIQRLMSSSTRAVRRFLERRLEVLAGGPAEWEGAEFAAGEETEPDEAAQLLLLTVPPSSREAEDVRRLLELAVRVEAGGPDARTEALYEQMMTLAREDGEPGKKFLLFTEFTATQEMLREFLEPRGYAVAVLNGGMDLAERKAAQECFREDAQVLISTDAGGEGLNLQFAHVVINYDLPWNPMRLEQRIGRVDRIGQKRAVRAINLALENSVEARVYDVLLTKLETILREFGVDKAGDVLDSREAGAQFEELARAALLQPETFETEFERVLVEIRRAAQDAQEARALYTEPVEPGDRPPTVPLRAWLRTLMADEEGGLPDDESGIDLSELTVERIHALRGHFAPGRPAPWLVVEGLEFELEAWFSLWRVGIADGLWRQQHVFSLCTTEGGGSYAKSAQRIWDELAAGRATVRFQQELAEYDFAAIERRAETEAALLYEGVVARSQERARRRLGALDLGYLARKSALGRIGLDTVREARRRELEEEYRRRRAEIATAAEALPDLQCLFLARMTLR